MIRQFRFPDDFLQVIALWEGSGPGVHLGRSDQQEEIAKKMQRDPDLFLVSEIDREIAGTVIGGFDGRRGMVYHLAVASKYRRQGIGEALMEELESRLRAKGCLKCYLLVLRENEGAMRFYEQRGWAQMDHVLIYAKEFV